MSMANGYRGAGEREALRVYRFPGIRSRRTTWRRGGPNPAASPLTAELLASVARGELVGEPVAHVPLEESLTRVGWWYFGSAFTASSFRVVLGRNTEQTGPWRLTRREFEVAQLVARGDANKNVGATLGVAEATVRGVTERALRKLGLRSTPQLPLLWHALGDPCVCFSASDGAEVLLFQTRLAILPLQQLTDLERLLVLGVLKGEHNAELANRRGVSVRTVANQLATLYRKWGVSSRRELVVRLLASVSGFAGDETV